MAWRISEDKDTKTDHRPVEDLAELLQLMEFMDRRKAKKADKEKGKKKDTKTKWLKNPDFEDKKKHFTITETASLLVLAAFPIAWLQLLFFKYFSHLLGVVVP
jgi:hypothetical protein